MSDRYEIIPEDYYDRDCIDTVLSVCCLAAIVLFAALLFLFGYLGVYK